jgi:hypothetical protein
MVSEDLIDKFCQAIARAEGFLDPNHPNDVPKRAHNPGNITDDGDLGLGVIQTGGPHGAPITIYASDADGWNALRRKVRRMLSGASHTYSLALTIEEVAIKWSGDPNWGVNVARSLGVLVETSLIDIVSQDVKTQDLKWPNA